MDIHKNIIRENTGMCEENDINKLISLLNELNFEENDKFNENKIVEEADINNSIDENFKESISLNLFDNLDKDNVNNNNEI